MNSDKYVLQEVVTPALEREWLDLPKKIYKGNRNWGCPLDTDIRKVFDPARNEQFADGEAVRWVVRNRAGEVVGRIAAFYNREKAALEEQPTGGCGFFESIDDQQVADLMFDASRMWLASRGMEAMDGPINFGQRRDWWGLLVEGYEFQPLYKNPYNPPYYKELFENYGFKNYFNQHSFIWRVNDSEANKQIFARAERLYTELDGLLLAPGAGQTLAQYGEILSGAVPEILPCIGCTQPGKWHCYDVWQHSAAAVGALDLRGQDTRGVRVLCWATFLHDIAKPLCRSVGPDGAAHFKGHNQRGAQLARVILRRLKAPAYLVDGAVGLIAVHDAPLPADDVGILKLLNRSGAIFLRRLCALKYADLDAHANTPEVAARRADVAAFERRMNELAKTGCYTMRQLAVNGADLMDIGIPAGPGVGATLQTLLNDVMEGTLPNEREALLAAAVK